MTTPILDQCLMYTLCCNLHPGSSFRMHFLIGHVGINCSFVKQLYGFFSFYSLLSSHTLICFSCTALSSIERGETARTCEHSDSFWKIFMLKDTPEFPEEERSECCEFLAVIMHTWNCVFCGGWGGDGICTVTFGPGDIWSIFLLCWNQRQVCLGWAVKPDWNPSLSLFFL